MKTAIPLFTALLLSIFLQAQTCSCPTEFDWLRQKMALNYAGYRDKVTPQNQVEFNRFTADFQAKAALITTDTACLRLMIGWARWFRDGHVQLSLKGSGTTEPPQTIRQRFQDWEKITLSEADARAYLDQPGRDPVEGIYQNAERNYRIALVRNATPERDFAAVILRADSIWWAPGQVKFDLKTGSAGLFSSRYYMRDHSMRSPDVKVASGTLQMGELGAWYRLYPGQPVPVPKPQVFTLSSLGDSTLLLRIPTMNESVRLELDSLIRANAGLLERTPNLIIDCRDNGGGSDVTFYPLRPYIYSGKVLGYKAQIYSTEDNIEKYEKLRHNKNFPKIYRLYFGHMARKMRRHKGEFVGKCGTEVQKFKKLKPNPRRVAILINGRCGSSCEQFIYYAAQSERVTLLGQNTYGVLDYGNLHTLDFPGGKFALAYPTSRSCSIDAGRAIDGVGLAPDVRIDASEKDWVEFARRYLERTK